MQRQGVKVVRQFNGVFVRHSSAQVQVDAEWDSAKPYKSIPGPSVLGLLRMFSPGGALNNKSLTEIQKDFQTRYGNVCKLPGFMGKEDIIFVYEPKDFEKIFRNEGEFPVRRGLDSFDYYRNVHRKDLFPQTKGLTSEHGEKWWDFRHKVNPVMMMPKVTKLYVPQIDQIALDFVERMDKVKDNQNKVPDEFMNELNKWAMESIIYITLDLRMGLFGSEVNPKAERAMYCLKRFFEYSLKLDLLPSIWKYYKTPTFKKHMANLDELINIIIEFMDKGRVALEQKQRDKVITNQEEGVLEKLLKIDKDVAFVMVLDSIAAGVDTTSGSLFNVLYCLATNADKQQVLREELMQTLPEKGSLLTAETMTNMPYLRACIKEAFRLRPLFAGNFRCTGKDQVFKGYKVPKNTNIAMAQEIIQVTDNYFFQGKAFLPERWLRDEKERKGCPAAKDTHPFVYLPFGFGPRMCIGRRFAELEIETLIIRLITRYKVEWNEPKPAMMKMSFINFPDGKMHFKLNPL